MKIPAIPFNLSLLNNDRRRVAGLLPVKVLDIFDQGGVNFHPQGLYSDVIFGPQGEESRNTRHSYVTLNTTVLHPKIFETLTRMRDLYKGIMSGKDYALWNEEKKDFEKADILTGQTGYAFFMEHYDALTLPRDQPLDKSGKSKAQLLKTVMESMMSGEGKTAYRRDLSIDLFEKYRDLAKLHWFVVMPAGLRDLERDESGRPVEDEINKLYRKLIATANGIPPALAGKNDPLLNNARWTLQKTIQDIYTSIMEMLSGKKGLLQSKWGSRRVTMGTRNVITAMDPAPDDLDSPRSYDITHTLVPIHQTIKGTEIVMSDFAMPNGIAQSIIANASSPVEVIDPTTLKRTVIKLSEKVRVAWGSSAGRTGLINDYEETGRRHLPILLDGHYLKLIYRDDKGFLLIDDIDDLPEGWDKEKVSPLTWSEYFYIELVTYIHRVRMFLTRYPITGANSIYPTVPYVKTTVTSDNLYRYSPEGALERTVSYPEMPQLDAAFFLTVAPSFTALENLGADFDGDFI